MDAPVILVAALILLHTADGKEVRVNPEQITSLHMAGSEGNKLITDEAHCLIRLTDAKFVSVVETCDAVRRLVEEARPFK